MRWLAIVWLRIRSLVLRSRVEDELDEELRFHLDQQAQALEATGLSPDAARRAALRSIGGLDQRKEQCRDTRRVGWIDGVVRDIQYAVRILRRSPGFTAVAVLSLALGIGANTAIFGLLDALRLRALALPSPHDLAVIRIANRVPGAASGNFDGRYPDFTFALWERIRDRQQGFSGVLAWSTATFDLSTRGEQRFAESAILVSGDFFEVLGVTAFRGRLFSAADDVKGCAAPGVVLGHGFWQREFGGSPSAIGSTLSINGRALAIVGVTPPRFYGVEVGRAFDLAVPLCADALISRSARLDQQSSTWWLSVMGRLKPGWSLARADSQLQGLSPAMFEETLSSGYSPETARTYRAFVLGAEAGASGVSRLRQQYDTPLWLLLSVAAVVLLVACANLANLLLARATARRREIAVRLALGASRGRLVRQLVVEGLVLAALGAACALVLAPSLGRALVALISTEIDRHFVDLRVDWRMLAFTAGVSLATCVLFGVAPALHATKVSGGDAMKGAARTAAGGARGLWLQRTLVVAQVALSMTLLVSGLLFARSLFKLLTVDTGFAQQGILEIDLDYRRLNHAGDRSRAFRREMLERVRALPGVDAAATASTIPFVGNWRQSVYFEGRADRRGRSNFSMVSDGYFETLRIPVRAGRDFAAADTPASPRVAIVNEEFARRFLPAAKPIGATFQLEGPGGVPGAPIEVIGVAGNTKYGDLREAFGPIAYFAVAQHAQPGPSDQILVRSRLPLAAVMASTTRALEQANRAIAFHYHDFQEQIRHSLMRERLMAALCGFFALLAVALATLGLYGVMSYTVVQRTSEIGIRLALGAGRASILRSILREAATLAGLGLVCGGALTLATSRTASSLLYGLRPNDPLTIGAAMLLLAVVALGASYLPARRAANADPMVALRCE